MMRLAGLLGGMALLAGCTVGPDYHRPSAPVSAVFKEQDGWQPARPASGQDRGPWWSVFNDPVLDRLERDIDVGNQNLRAYEAAYRQAVALVAEARAGYYPTVAVSPSVTRARSGRSTATSNVAEGTISWDIDVWCKVRRQVESQEAAAQASQADLADIRLSAQAELATDYINLRTQDSLAALLSRTVGAYQHSLDIVQNQYAVGVSARADVITAQTQLQSARTQLIDTQVSRATNEHAVALLTGRPPAGVTIPPGSLADQVPAPPDAVASTLLERRPDIAAAERTMQQQKALIGVAVAAYYPTINLSAAFGYAGSPLSGLIASSNQLWSLVASGSQTIFDGELRRGEVDATRAAYEQSVATYRQTVLTAFQDVEDELSTLRILASEAEAQQQTATLARQATQITLDGYRAGTEAYTAIVTAQATQLSAEQSLISIQQSRMTADIALVKALGGGWAIAALAAHVDNTVMAGRE